MSDDRLAQTWITLETLLDTAKLLDVEKILENTHNSLGTTEEKASWLYYKGRMCLEKSLIEESIGNFNEAKKSTEFLPELLVDKLNIQLSIAYCRQGNFKSALSLLELASTHLEKSVHISLYSLALNWIGNIYWLTGDLKNALSCHKKNLEIREKNQDLNALASTLNNIGIIYRVQGRLVEAQTVYEQALKTAIPNPRIQAFLYTNFGILNYEQNDYENALKRHYMALDIREKLGNMADVADSVFNIIRVLVSTNSFSNNHPILKRFPEENQLSPVILALKHLIDAFLAILNNDWQLAEEHWRTALNTKGLEYGYQIICYENLVDAALRNWQKQNSYTLYTQLLTRLEEWEQMCIKNNLTASLCKVYLIFAKISLAKLQLEDANEFLAKCITLSSEMGLPLHQQLALKELIEIESMKDKVLQLYNLSQDDFFDIKLQEATVYVKELAKVLTSLDTNQ